MPATVINMPPYRVLRALQVPEPDAEAAAAAALPDLGHRRHPRHRRADHAQPPAAAARSRTGRPAVPHRSSALTASCAGRMAA